MLTFIVDFRSINTMTSTRSVFLHLTFKIKPVLFKIKTNIVCTCILSNLTHICIFYKHVTHYFIFIWTLKQRSRSSVQYSITFYELRHVHGVTF